MANVFISKDKTKFICAVGDSPSFMRRSHSDLLKQNGVNLNKATNLTAAFFYTGKGQSINNFLESA